MILNEARRDAFMPLEATHIPASVTQRLAALGVTTVEELRDFWVYGNRQWLVDYLGDSPVRFSAVTPPAGANRGTAVRGPGNTLNLFATGPTPPLVKRPRGVVLTAAQRRHKAVQPEPLPATGRRLPAARRPSSRPLTLASRFPSVRDQGQRGTCVAFASLALLEYHLGASRRYPRLTEQFLYWACKKNDGIPQTEGTFVDAARQVIGNEGACLASTWEYNATPIAGNEGQGPPPKGAADEAKQHVWPSALKIAAGDVEALQTSLKDKKPAVLSVLTYPQWDFPAVERTGEIVMPLPGDEPDGAHAICLVGYELNAKLPGGGAFIFRNSWGSRWARRSGRFGAGYGTVLFEYIRQYALEAFA